MTDQLEDKLEWVALGMAIFLLGLACYRLLLTKWRSDIDLRSYPFLRPLDSRILNGIAALEVELSEDHSLELAILNKEEHQVLALHTGELEAGIHSIPVDTSEFDDGEYFIRLTSKGQVDTKRIEIRNNQL